MAKPKKQFTTRRKTIANSMKTYFGNPATADELMLTNIPDVLQRAGVSAKSRGESLEREAFIELGHATWSFMAKPRKQPTTRRALCH